MDDFETTTLVDAVAKMLVDADIVMSGKYAFVGRSSSGGSSGGGHARTLHLDDGRYRACIH